MRRIGVSAIAFILFAFAPALAHAAPVTSPDEICAAADNPCVVGAAFEVDSAYPLDFGLRTVRIVPGGKLVGSLDLLCGGFEVALAPDVSGIEVVGAMRATVTARRACSGDSVTPCLLDATCANASLGACSVGDGGIRIIGVVGGVDTPRVELRAAGDIEVQGSLLAKGSPPQGNSGDITIDSEQGGITSSAAINMNVGRNEDYGEPGLVGNLTMRAERDITITGPIAATGGNGMIDVSSNANVRLQAPIEGSGMTGSATRGDTLDFSALGNLEILDSADAGTTNLNISGGRQGSYYGGTYAGRGGYGYFKAGNDLTFGSKVFLKGDSGASFGYTDDSPGGSCLYLEANGALAFDSRISARGQGWHGYGCRVELDADAGVDVGTTGSISTRALDAGKIDVTSFDGPISIEGRLDARGGRRVSYGSWYGYGGPIFIAGDDITVSGDVMTGGGAGAQGIEVRACRLRLASGGIVSSRRGRQHESPGYNDFSIRESMVSELGSRALSHRDGSTLITYRDPNKPPVLDGIFSPAATLVVDSSLPGCPVCGNSEIDEGETCDDGNVVAGDGCSDLCQIE